jgi:hypothetical protein
MVMQDDEPRKRENLVNFHRREKGDLDVSFDSLGFVTIATVKQHSVFNMLCVMGKADDGHVSAVLTYEDWKAAFQSIFCATPSRLYRQSDQGSSESDKASKYMLLIHQLGQTDGRIVEQAIMRRTVPEESMRKFRTAVWDARHHYLSPIEKLGRCISEINKAHE